MIELVASSFSIEVGGDACNFDSVAIYDGAAGMTSVVTNSTRPEPWQTHILSVCIIRIEDKKVYE